MLPLIKAKLLHDYLYPLVYIMPLVLIGCAETNQTKLNITGLDIDHIIKIQIHTKLPSIGIINIKDKTSILGVIEWLKKAETPKKFASYVNATIEINIIYNDKNIDTFKISQPGPNYAAIKYNGKVFLTSKHPPLDELTEWINLYSSRMNDHAF